MLTKCIKCEFNVRLNDRFCLNCGIQSPSNELNQSSASVLLIYNLASSLLFKIICSLLTTILLILATIDWNLTNIFYIRQSYLFAVLILGLVTPILILFLIEKWCLRKFNAKRLKATGNFSSRIKLIDNRLLDLDRRKRQIDLILERIDEKPSSRLNSVKPELSQAREIINNQSARYELQKQKIELVRLQNTISPYLVGWNQLNEFEVENGLVTIKNSNQEVNKLRQKLAKYKENTFSKKSSTEINNFLTQLSETETSFEQLREALLSRQAVRALQGVSTTEENLPLLNTNKIVHATETFNIQTTLTDFSESFDELEREYQRLKAEENIGQKLLND